MDFQKALKDLPAYGDFLIDFAQSPRRAFALAVYEGTDDNPDHQGDDGPADWQAQLSKRLNATLLFYVVISVAVGYVIAALGALIGMAEDSSQSIALVRAAGPKALPAFLVIAVILVAAVFHLVIKGWAALWRVTGRLSQRVIEDPPPLAPEVSLTGSVKATINAAFGFVAFMVPLLTLLLVSMLIALEHVVAIDPVVLVVIISLFWAAALAYYLPAAFSAVHPGMTFSQAFVALAIPWALWMLGEALLGG